jgi:hypothetical protein
VEEAPAFTAEELQAVTQSLRLKEAPGPDMIQPEDVRTLVREVPEVFLEVMNACLRTGTIPKMWKVARLILLPKGKSRDRRKKVQVRMSLGHVGQATRAPHKGPFG